MADPVRDLKQSVDKHFDAAVGTHVRAVRGAAEFGGRIVDAADRVRRWWRDDGRGPRRTTDIRLPTEGRRQTRRR